MITFFRTIIEQANAGNFSAFILAVNVATLVYMIWRDKNNKKK